VQASIAHIEKVDTDRHFTKGLPDLIIGLRVD
jgi:hypothetical protein